jgi:putative nucleotidyltransferase with HDIG domain
MASRAPEARGPSVSDAWAELAASLMAHDDYDERLRGMLRVAGEATGTPDGYLYLVEPSQRRLHLAQTRARPAAASAPAGPADQLAQPVEGGAEWSAPTVPLELVRSEDLERERTVVTPVGTLYSLPLREPDGTMIGLLQTGPVGARGPGRGARRRLDALAAPLGFVAGRARREEALRRQLAAAEARLEGSRRLAGAAVDLDRFVALLLDLALTGTGARSGFVAIVERPGEAPVVRIAANMPPGFAEEVDLSPIGGLFDWSLADGDDGGALILKDFEAAERLGLGTPVAVPLLERGEPLGIFALDFGAGGAFDEEALELLGTFADQVTLMLDNARLFATFAERYLGTVRSLAAALDARRPHTHDHHERVAQVAVALDRELGGDATEAHALREAALIHDVGLAGAIGIEGGTDTDVEHPTLGARLIEHLPLAPAVAGAVATHHEWFDGWGFPRGLHGEAIPRAGRILALAEFLVEMGTGDATRAPWPLARLADDVAQRRGSQFDPEVADAALRLAARGGLDLVPHGA